MAPNTASIDVEGSNLICSEDDILKLSSSEGCSLNIVTDKVMKMDESAYSDEEDPFDEKPFNKESEIERMKREYIMMTLNANRDPVKPGYPTRVDKLYRGKEAIGLDEHPEYLPLADIESQLKKRYSKLGDFDELLKSASKPAFEEISKGRVYKRRLTAGFKPCVVDNSMVIYNCALWAQGSPEPFDSTWLRRTTILTDLETDSILPGLHELLLTTKKGEWCEALIRPEAAFGRLGAMPRIPPNATIFCLLEIVQVLEKNNINILAKNPSQAQQDGVSFQDFYEASDEARMRGNYYLEQGQYKAALQRYKSGIRILEALTYKDAQEEKQAQSLLLKLYNNCAKAANNSGDPRLALVACKQASLIDDREPKTHWNRMMAWKKKGHTDRALGCARRAIQLFTDPKLQKSFRQEADDLRRRIQREQNDIDNLHRLMSKAIITQN